ncbi:MAG TPA: M20/M25/M40 family metallo-hydrolase [Burkholderiaceae bacterium]
MKMNKTGAALAAMACLLAVSQAQAQAPAAPAADRETLFRIRDAAMGTDYAYQRLTDLTDLVGPRLSGSPGAAAAVDMVSAEMKKIGMQVTLQPVKAPHWVRGTEAAELIDYQGRPAGITQKLILTALGGSSATPAGGITAPVLLAHDMDDLNAHKDQVKGAIVVFDAPFDEQLAQAGRAGNAYGEAGKYRFVGPAAASKLGAAAALVRSVGGANYRVPHTGMTGWGDGAKPIPAGALTAEDVMLIDRLAAKGPLKMHLTLTPQTLPDVDSADVLADIPGSDKADEVVLISGHLDSWDLAQGATDDGAGVSAAMGVAEVFKRLGLKPRRTVRMVAWMNEENGSRGEKAYFDAYKDKMGKHFAAIETDSGATHPIGIMTSAAFDDLKSLDALKSALRSIGAPLIDWHDRLGPGDLYMLEDAGVPCFEPMLDTRTYFDYHHTPADTLDKVDPLEMKKQVAVLAMLTWYLAEMPQELKRVPKAAD